MRLHRVPHILCAIAWLPTAVMAQATWYVDGANPGCPGTGASGDPFCTIAAALDAASPGDTIQVAAGSYQESIVIDTDDLHLVGAGAAVTTIAGPPVSYVVWFASLPRPVTRFSMEGFRVTTSDPGPGNVVGLSADAQGGSAPHVRISGCVVDGVDLGISFRNSSDLAASMIVEDTVVSGCGTGIELFGIGHVIRRCTIADIDEVGVVGILPGTSFRIEDSIIAGTGAWAVQRYWNAPVTIERLLIHENNLSNPSFAPEAGPFMQYLAEGWPGGFGVWAPFEPLPGPVLAGDPLFVDPGGGDWRLLPGSPAIDAAPPPAAAEAGSYDVQGFGHLRVDDGDFDGLERLDLGAHEFGGLLTTGGGTVGATLTAELWGPPNAQFGVFAGAPGPPLDLGPKGALFLDPAHWLLAFGGSLSPGGNVLLFRGSIPAGLAGLEFGLQVLTKAAAPSGALHWTNFERVAVAP